MAITYYLPSDEITTLEQIVKNHADASTRQRANLVLLCSVVRRSSRSERPFAPVSLSVLIERYRKYGFFCLLPTWDMQRAKTLFA